MIREVFNQEIGWLIMKSNFRTPGVRTKRVYSGVPA